MRTTSKWLGALLAVGVFGISPIAIAQSTPDPLDTPDSPTIPEPTIPEPTTPEPITPEPMVPEPMVPEPMVPETPTVPEPTIPQPPGVMDTPSITDTYDLYEFYGAGYDTNLEDDWFYDYYSFSPAEYDYGYDYYTDYDYNTNAFAWEEDGLFEERLFE